MSTGSTMVPDQVDIGKLASGYALNGGSGVFSVEDRDSSGSRIALHDGIGFTAMADMKQFYDLKKPYAGTSPAQPNYMQPTGDILDAARSDGYSAGYGNTFQGVRVFDPNMAQWTAPDAYAGDVHDPMSQKPFMWNNNDPLDFEDPTGYAAVGAAISAGAAASGAGAVGGMLLRALIGGVGAGLGAIGIVLTTPTRVDESNATTHIHLAEAGESQGATTERSQRRIGRRRPVRSKLLKRRWGRMLRI